MNYQDFLKTQANVDGVWCDADDGNTFAVRDPGSCDLLGSVPMMGAA